MDSPDSTPIAVNGPAVERHACVVLDEEGVPRLDVDVLHAPENRSRAQLEVRFDLGE